MNASPHAQAPSLATVYRDHFNIGVAVNPAVLKNHADLVRTQFNSVTCENEMKFEFVHPRPGKYTFERADGIVDFASANNMKVRGHTLAWHWQTPAWFFHDDEGNLVDKETLYARMKEHISTVAGRYAGKVYCWDVVNEAIADERGDYLRANSEYAQIAGGEEFIEKAFRYAHEADPAALLFYNDYNTENPVKRAKVYRLLSSLLAKGVPVHGLGIQAHYDYCLDVEELRTTIEMFAPLGLAIHITELDVSLYDNAREWDAKWDVIPAHRVRLQAEVYQKIFALLREKREHVQSVTFWGAADDVSWLQYFPIPRKNAPLLFDAAQQPKEAFFKVVEFGD